MKAYLPNLMPKNGGGGGGEMTLVTPTNVAQAHISGPGGGQPPLQPNMRLQNNSAKHGGKYAKIPRGHQGGNSSSAHHTAKDQRVNAMRLLKE